MKLINNQIVVGIYCAIFVLLVGCNLGSSEMPGLNYELFKNTEAEELAEYVRDEDVVGIKRCIRKDKSLVNFQEPKYGNTLLSVAIICGKTKSVDALLSLGADPNISNKENASPFLIACSMYGHTKVSMEIIELLVKHHANLDFQQEKTHEHGVYYTTPLQQSVDVSDYPDDELFYYLVDKGANINLFNGDSTSSVLLTTLIQERMDLAKLLIIEKKCIIPRIVNTVNEGLPDEEEEGIVEFLKEEEYEKGSLNDKNRNEILKYLESKGYK